MIPIHFDKQIIPGTFEHTLHYLIDNEIDLSIFDLRYQNDDMGAPAYDPAILLKIILYAYSKGITSSRKIAQCCMFLFSPNYSYCSDNNLSVPPDQKLKVIEERKMKDVFYFKDGQWTNLTSYNKPNHIYDYKISPNGKYAFVWHMVSSPRLLSIYELKNLVLQKDLKLGFGGDVKWNRDNHLVHVYGCGSGCSDANVFNLEGKTLFEIGGSPIEVSPSGRYLAFFTIDWVGKQNFELYDLSHQYLIRHKAPLFVVNGVGNVDSIDWNDEQIITIKYTDVNFTDDSGHKEAHVDRAISLDLGKY